MISAFSKKRLWIQPNLPIRYITSALNWRSQDAEKSPWIIHECLSISVSKAVVSGCDAGNAILFSLIVGDLGNDGLAAFCVRKL